MKKTSFTLIFIAMIGLILNFGLVPVDAQDIAELMAEKYSLEVDEKIFDIYYGFKGSLEIDVSSSEVEKPKVEEMFLNKEKKLLEINFDENEYAGPIWFRLPPELISAEGGEFQLLIDDVDKPFELTYYTDDVSIGFFLPKNSQSVEIIGTNVIPEFGTIAVLVLASAIASLILVTRKKVK